MTPVEVVALVVVVVALMVAVRALRRRQADLAAQQLGGVVLTGALPTPYGPPPPMPPGGIGMPNPALPPAPAPDQRTGILTSGPPVELRICGLPALAWQRTSTTAYRTAPMRLSLIVDTAVGLPVLQLFHRSALLHPPGSGAPPIGVAALDQQFEITGDLAAWGPLLARPDVQHALLSFPIDSVTVVGGRFSFVSRDGVHLDPGAVSAVAQVAATLVSAVPRQLTSRAAAPPPSALAGANPGDVDGFVRAALAQSRLSPGEQDAMLALIRAQRPDARRPGQQRGEH